MKKNDGRHLLQSSNSAYWLSILCLTVFLLFSLLFAVSVGAVQIPLKNVYEIVLGNIGNWFSHLFRGTEYVPISGAGGDVVWHIRMPRLLLALTIGTGLAVCGVIMQAVVKNPLAEPYVLGISSGASLGATSAVLLGIGAAFGANSVGVMACLGAFGISIGVVAISNIGGRSNSVKLLLAGMALSSVCSAFSISRIRAASRFRNSISCALPQGSSAPR